MVVWVILQIEHGVKFSHVVMAEVIFIHRMIPHQLVEQDSMN